MRKIYNEIVIDMNPESPSFEKVLYEDYEYYNGIMAMANGVVCSPEPSNTDISCCKHNPWLKMWDIDGNRVNLEQPNAINVFADADGDDWYDWDDYYAGLWFENQHCDDGYTMIRLEHACGSTGGDEFCEDTGLTSCCVPNTVKSVQFDKDRAGSSGAWYGRNPFCNISFIGTNAEQPCSKVVTYMGGTCESDNPDENYGGLLDEENCKRPAIGGTEPWDFISIDLGENAFLYSGANNTWKEVAWLCGLALDGNTVKACNGYTTDDFLTQGGYSDYAIQCECPQSGCNDDENAWTLQNGQGSSFIDGCFAGGVNLDGDVNEWGTVCNLSGTDSAGRMWSSFCDTETMQSSPDSVEQTQCGTDGQTYCSCGMLNECGVCQSPIEENPDPGCGAIADACGDWGGFASSAVIEDYVNIQGDMNIIRYRMISGGYDQYYNPSWNDNDPTPTVYNWQYNSGQFANINPCMVGYVDTDGDGTLDGPFDNFCYCNCEDSGDPHPFPIECYSKTTGNLQDETTVFWACPGETCEDFGVEWSSDYVEAFDSGCRNPNACNYNEFYENDCTGNQHRFFNEDSGEWEDDGIIGNDTCCVYPVNYCVADGTLYDVAGSSGWVATQAGLNDLCDVSIGNEPFGTIDVVEMCPSCEGIEADLPECGDYGYGIAEWNSSKPAKITSISLKGSGDCIDYCRIYAGTSIDINTGDTISVPTTMYDTCTGNCGLDGTGGATGWSLYGCNDEAALNYELETPLYQNPNINLSLERPVTTCVYCPGGAGEIGEELSANLGCPEGYDFYWSDYQHVTDSSQALVTDSTFDGGSNSNFYLGDGSVSSNLTDSITDFSQGHCYCRADLTFLRDISYMSPVFTVGDDSIDPWRNVIQLSAYGGQQKWDSYGRLNYFSAGGENCDEGVSIETCRTSYLQLGGQGVTDEYKTLPTSIQNLDNIQHLDLSYQYITGQIPKEVESIAFSPYIETIHMNLSHNYFQTFDLSYNNGHGIELGTDWHGICAIVELRGYPTDSDPWLQLMGNHICPSVASSTHRTFAYPECLVPPYNTDINSAYSSLMGENLGWCNWIQDNIGFADIPCFENFDPTVQNITNGPPDWDILPNVCIISGCVEAEAKNYWPEATADCGGTQGGNDSSCCMFDRYLHFPWGDDIEITPGAAGSYGGDMGLFDMVQALHTNIHGFQYNSRGEVDVTNTPFLEGASAEDPQCLYSGPDNGNGAYLTNYQMTDCNYWFQNQPLPGDSLAGWALSDGIVNHWDGIWLKYSNYIASGTAMCGETPDGLPEQCLGDSRMLDFINRVEYEASFLGENAAGFREYWWSWFPIGGMDVSMQGIQWLEDYDLDGDGDLTINDAVLWESIGRIDIAELIRNGFEGQQYPESEPEDVELWEQAPSSVSMSYSQKFITEAQAGFTLYPSNISPGVLTRNGQWQCDDGGSAEVCYSDIYSCGRAPEWIDECTPCGNGNGTCIPITLETAAEGHEKISKTKTLVTPYFSEANASILYGRDIYTASLSSSNHPYYYAITDGDPNSSKSNIQFTVAWGHYAGSGSDTKSDTIRGSSEAIYKQYASLLLDDVKVDDGFLISSGSDVTGELLDGNKDEWIYVLNFKRKNFGDQLSAGNWTLNLSGSAGKIIHLTDDSLALTTPSVQSQAGRRYNIVSGSNGSIVDSGFGNRYGFYYPDFGLMVLGEKISREIYTTGNPPVGAFNSSLATQNQLHPLTSSNADGKNALRLINCMKNIDATSNTLMPNGAIKLYGETEVTEVIYICRISGESFNFTNNFSIISGSGRVMYSEDTGVMDGFPTAEVSSSAFLVEGQSSQIFSGSIATETVTTLENLEKFIHPGVNKTTMHGNPHTFITGIELYDEHGECLAIARPSKPIKNAFDREVVIKVKLTY